MTKLYLAKDQDGQVQAHRNPPGESVEINEDFSHFLFYGQEFTGDGIFLSPSPNELVYWADGRGPVEINIIPVVD